MKSKHLFELYRKSYIPMLMSNLIKNYLEEAIASKNWTKYTDDATIEKKKRKTSGKDISSF